MSTGLLVGLIIGGALLLVAGLLVMVLALVRRANARTLSELQIEGITCDSGVVHVQTSFRGYRTPSRYVAFGSRAGPGRLVLTAKRLVLLPRHAFSSIARDALGHFQVGGQGGQLLIHTENPPGGSGTVDIEIAVANPNEWVALLLEAGARPFGN